jgi:hypothetical protein
VTVFVIFRHFRLGARSQRHLCHEGRRRGGESRKPRLIHAARPLFKKELEATCRLYSGVFLRRQLRIFAQNKRGKRVKLRRGLDCCRGDGRWGNGLTPADARNLAARDPSRLKER